jgi:hypothetical protein
MLKEHQLPQFFINFRIDMVIFVNPHEVIARTNAFLAFPSVWNGIELEGNVENEMSIFTNGKGFGFTRDP